MKSAEKKMSYAEAVAKLEELVKKIESPDISLTEVTEELKSAMELIKYCKKELRGYEEEFEKILEIN